MLHRRLVCIAAATCALGPVAARAEPEATAVDWRAAAQKDVAAAYDIYVANHPGMHDPLNPGFADQLKRARDSGLAIAAQASSMIGYANALGAFSAEVADGHAQVMASQTSSSSGAQRMWPGFIAAWRGRLLVHQADAASPAPTGSEILGCDGLSAVAFIRRQIGYRGFRPKEAGHWWYRPTQAFYQVEGLWPGPKSCTFRLPDGTVREARLAYQPVPFNFPDMLTLATDGERTPIGLSEPRHGLFLIGMPDFNPDDQGVKAYQKLFSELARRRPAIRQAEALVIDLRHNNGGSSEWSRKAARELWGERAVDRRMDRYFKDVRIWWRASPDNTAYVASLESRLRKHGLGEAADSMREVAAGMKKALDRGEPYFVEAEEKPQGGSEGRAVSAAFTTPVYVIVPGRCASACLDALDLFTRFPHVKLIGAPSSGDSTYMDVRAQDLPSGQGRIIIPNKLWAGRPRAAGEVYGPHILMTDLDWSTAAFLDRIERDLGQS